MNDIKIFESAQFGQVRTTGTSEEPLFCLADVCKALGLQAKHVIERIDRGAVSTVPLATAGGVQQANFINEDGLYDVILDSRKPSAKKFRKWVTSEVLPSIRKHGGYIAEKQDETPEELMSRALQVANETLKRKEARLRQLEDTNREQQKQLDEAAPKVEYVDKVLQSVNTYTVQQIAKELDTTVRKLYAFLKEKKVLFRQSDTWMLTAKYNGKGYAKTRTYQYTRNDGTSGTKTYTVMTEAGREFIHQLYNTQN